MESSAHKRSPFQPFEICVFRAAGHRRRRKPARSRFSDDGRRKVGEVRNRRACLRCKALKISCSGGDPCTTCVSLTKRTVQAAHSSALTWSYCIRTSFEDVNIFRTAFDQNSVSAGLAQLTQHKPVLSFDVEWSCDHLVKTAVDWLLDTAPPCRSMVGTLSSPEFQKLSAKQIDSSLVEDSSLLLYAASQAHVKRMQGDDGGASELGYQTLTESAYYTGQRVVDRLDKTLLPQNLAKASKEALQMMLLTIVAIILAVGYVDPLSASPEFPDQLTTTTCSGSRPTLWEVMQHHICEMLSHHLIIIASKLRVRFGDGFQRKLITSALSRWDKAGRFTWVESQTLPHQPDCAFAAESCGGSSCSCQHLLSMLTDSTRPSSMCWRSESRLAMSDALLTPRCLSVLADISSEGNGPNGLVRLTNSFPNTDDSFLVPRPRDRPPLGRRDSYHSKVRRMHQCVPCLQVGSRVKHGHPDGILCTRCATSGLRSRSPPALGRLSISFIIDCQVYDMNQFQDPITAQINLTSSQPSTFTEHEDEQEVDITRRGSWGRVPQKLLSWLV
ncbi:hypothetical protein QBC47DRAFT_415437 [Echria macrotheca]|uniref:Zn(2)-C6 fungal-type domain-containing protein n=1 Tax=Echria macrotheca TaxID=438768 RepID=A0AAJ0F3N4_9PEZI|nr:hypothetical protein QBC47DRAFT_415437 [Echria macrotheca]